MTESKANVIADFSNLSPEEARQRKREWNRGPLRDLFPRIPEVALERVLDLCIDKAFTYNLSEARSWNARRYTCIVVAHVRHFYTRYDALLRGGGGLGGEAAAAEDAGVGLERYEARRRTADESWRVLRQWCPWDDSNALLEPCFRATLLPPEQREPGWDPMDIDDESDYAPCPPSSLQSSLPSNGHFDDGDTDDPMDLD